MQHNFKNNIDMTNSTFTSNEIKHALEYMMINELSQQGLVHLPKIHAIRGDAKGRVEVRFESPHCTINAPLDYLRSRLIRRFGNKTRR